MKKFAFGIEYDGTNYCGWQKQKNCITIQTELEKAISKVANTKIEVTASGRTDKGVHAIEQVIHFLTNVNRNENEWLQGVNANLPEDIKVLWIKEVADDFHARFSAQFRQYKYLIYNSKLKLALFKNYFTHYYKELDCDKMQQAANLWLGENDFASFRDSDCQSKTSIRFLKQLSIIRNGKLVTINVVANSFLHHMVRNMVGTLIEIGTNNRDIDWAKEVLVAKDRKCAGITAPATGLYFVRANYSSKFCLPSSAKNSCIFSVI